MIISEAFALYRKAEIVMGGLSSKTEESYRYCAKLVIDFFGDVNVTSLRAEDVRGFYEHLLTWQRPDTARGNIICPRSVLKYLKRKDYRVLDVDDIKIPKREKREIQYLTKAEFEEFAEVVGEKRRGYPEINRLRNLAIVNLLFTTGIRVSELCRLNRNSIKDRQFIVIGKSKEPRLCFITSEVEDLIDKYMDLRIDKNPALFIANQTERRITPGNVRRVFQNACARSDFEGVHPHTLRHSFATYMLDRNVDIRYIADLMGHQSLDTTRVYTHYANPKLKQIYQIAMEESKN